MALLALYRLRYGWPWKGLLGRTGLGAAALGYAVLRAAAKGTDVVFAAVAACIVLVALAVLYALRRPGVRITGKDQPELFALVLDVAARAGLPPPTAVWLTHTAEVEALARMFRRELLIGRALVPCLAENELRSLIAHELAILALRGPRLAVRLTRLWTTATVAAALPSARANAIRTASDLQQFGNAVHAVADAAAINAAGHRDAAARAAMLRALIDIQYDNLADETATPAPRWPRSIRVIEDLDDAWQRWIAHVPPTTAAGSDAIELLELAVERPHPTLAASAPALLGHRYSIRPAKPSVRLRPLSRRHQRRLARHLRKLATNHAVRWYTCATAPASWWSDRANREADAVRPDIATVLGREPVDTFEAIELLVTRNMEVMAALYARAGMDPEPPQPEETEYTPPPIVCMFVEDDLLHRGWHLDHPAIRGVLTGPNGEHIDTARSVTRTESGYDLEPLRSVLRPNSLEAPTVHNT